MYRIITWIMGSVEIFFGGCFAKFRFKILFLVATQTALLKGKETCNWQQLYPQVLQQWHVSTSSYLHNTQVAGGIASVGRPHALQTMGWLKWLTFTPPCRTFGHLKRSCLHVQECMVRDLDLILTVFVLAIVEQVLWMSYSQVIICVKLVYLCFYNYFF